MDNVILNIGYSAGVVACRVVAILSVGSSPMKRLKTEAKVDRRLIDATYGRKTRSVIVTDSNHIVQSAVQADTLAQRFEELNGNKGA